MQTLAKYKKICYHKQADFDNDKKRPHGQAVKTLPSHGRICGSIPHGATKKIQHHLVWCCIFLYAPERKRRGNLFAVVRICVSKFCRSSPFYGSQENPKRHANGNGNFRMGLRTSSLRETTRQLVAVVRQFAQANSCRRLPSPALILSYQLHMGNGNFRMGLRTSSLRETTRQLVAVVRQFAQTNSCRRLPSPALLLSCQLHMENGNFRMGLHTSSVRETTRQLVCRRSYLRQQILAVGSHRPHFCLPVSYIWETATSAWGCILLRCAETTRQLHFYMIKDFPD